MLTMRGIDKTCLRMVGWLVRKILGKEHHLVDWFEPKEFRTGNSIFKETTAFFANTQGTKAKARALNGLLAEKGQPATED